MALPTVNVTIIPTGGVVRLDMPDYMQPPSGVTQVTIGRAVSGSTGLSAFTPIYSGAPCPVFLDVGDGLPQPLDPLTDYIWQVTDSRGTTQTAATAPASSVTTVPDQLSQVLIRALQGALNSVVLPDGIPLPTVTTKMPQGGWVAPPYIVVNLDLIQQTEVQIGEDLPNPDANNDWTLFANAKRVWRVTVFSRLAEERDFFRDYLLVVFRVLKATAFGPIGLNVSHSFQAASYTDTNEWDGHSPGFYGADLMLEINGVFPTAVLTAYGTIKSISTVATAQSAAGGSVAVSGTTR